MNDRNKNRPGYKGTKVGWIPEEWEVEKLMALTATPIKNGYSPICPNDSNGKWILGLGALGEHGFNASQIKPAPINDSIVDNFILKTGDFLISRSNTPRKVGLSALFNGEVSNCSYPDLMMRFRVKKEAVFPHFLAVYLKHAQASRYFERAASGTSDTMVKITKNDVQKLTIPLPPLPEQKKIAEVLGCWDEGIGWLEDLIEQKRLRKKGLMQKLLTGTRRLPEFQRSEDGGQRSEWKEVTLGSICTVIRKAVGTKKIIPMSLSAGKGFVSQAEKFGRDISGNQYSKYTHLKNGCFTYNKGNSIRYPQGCAYLLEDYDEVAVPNVFISFKLDDTKADNRFFQQAFAANMHGHDLMKFINSGVRNDGLLNLNTEWFLRITFDLPSIDEQRAIAEVLETADEEIRLLEAERDLLAEQKKGLMQKLLTGEIRCPEFQRSEIRGQKSAGD